MEDINDILLKYSGKEIFVVLDKDKKVFNRIILFNIRKILASKINIRKYFK